MERMSKLPVIVSSEGIIRPQKVPVSEKLFQEDWIQELLEKEPSILPTAQIDQIFSPLMFIAREVETEAGYIDNLYISSKGYLVIVETKLWRNPEARREVVGQILDYAKEVCEWNYQTIDEIYQAYHKSDVSLYDKMVELKYNDAVTEASFIDTVEKNIKASRFLLMIVGDGIREGVERMTDFLNRTPTMQYQFALCELEVYQMADGKRLVIPQLTTKTKIVERGVIRIEKESGRFFGLEQAGGESESVTERVTKKKNLTMDEWIAKTKLSEADVDELNRFLDDLSNVGFSYHIGTADMSIYFYDEKYAKAVYGMWIFKSARELDFQPSAYYSFAEKYGYSSTIVDRMLAGLKPFLMPNQKNTPYERLNGYYGISVKTILAHRSEVVRVLEEFAENF